MFTGIIERIGTISDTQPVSGGRRLCVDAGPIATECIPGASVAVSGVCLTVVDTSESTISFDVITETLDKSTLGTKRIGDGVNLELSLRVDGRLDGHFVQGHVDGRATVKRIDKSSSEHVVWLQPESTVVPYIIPKGSVAVDGVSLTVAAVTGHTFSIALIPTTLERTTLSTLRTGHDVNIETDIITRTLVSRLESIVGSGGLTMDALREAGFA